MLDIIILGIGQQSIAILIGLPGVVRVAVGPLPLEIRYSTVPSTGYLTNTFWSLQPNRIRQKIPLTPFLRSLVYASTFPMVPNQILFLSSVAIQSIC